MIERNTWRRNAEFGNKPIPLYSLVIKMLVIDFLESGYDGQVEKSERVKETLPWIGWHVTPVEVLYFFSSVHTWPVKASLLEFLELGVNWQRHVYIAAVF